MNMTVVVVTAIICFALCYICKETPKSNNKSEDKNDE